MGAFVLWCWGGWMPVRVFLCLFWHETHTKSLRARFPTRPGEDEERQGPKAVNRSRGKATVRERRAAKRGVGVCGLRSQVSQRERASQRSWWLCGNFTRIHARDSPQMHRKPQKSVINFSPLALGANLSPCCLFFFFSSTLSVVYVVSYVFVKQCKILLVGDERKAWRSDGHELV